MSHCKNAGRQFILGISLAITASCSSVGVQPMQTPTQLVTQTSSPSPSPTKVVVTPEPTPTNQPIVVGEVSIWLDWSQEELAVLYTHLAAFQEKFPDIQISVSYFPPDELLERFRAAAEVGQGPTILLGPSDWTRLLSQDGSIRDIQGRTMQEFIETIQPVAWEGVTRDTSLMGLPYSMEGIVLYRNRGLVAESPESLDELVSYAQQLEGEEQSGIKLDIGFLYTGSFLHTCDGELLGSDGTMALTIKAGQCWLEILGQWSLAGSVTRNTEEDLEAFEAGQAAWLLDGTWNAQRIMTALGTEQVAIDPWPVYSPTEKILAGYAWSKNIFFGTSSEDEDFDAAWILARYLLTPEVQGDFAESTYGLHMPVLLSVPSSERWLQELMVAMGSNVPLPLYPQFSIFSEHLEIAAVDVSRRGYDPYFAILWVHPKIEKDLIYSNFEEE